MSLTTDPLASYSFTYGRLALYEMSHCLLCDSYRFCTRGLTIVYKPGFVIRRERVGY